MQVPFLDLKAGYAELASELDETLLRVANSGWYIGGKEVTAFESSYATYTQSKHCVGVANGLDALILSLKALDIGIGDEVLVPSHTFIATWLAVSSVGAIPIPVEPTADGYNMDTSLLESLITTKTKAILPVHLYGIPADILAICQIAKKNHLYVIEDAAQAHGAMVDKRRIGSHSDAVAWSFYPGKNLGALGDGGAVTTNNDDVAERIRKLGNYGSQEKYVHDLLGVNSRLDPLQAAVLSIKLNYLESWNARRQHLARVYLDGLSELPLRLPQTQALLLSAWHLFVIKTPLRDKLQNYLTKHEIQTLIHYPIPPHKQRCYANSPVSSLHLPLAERYANEILSLPIGPQLSTDHCKYVVDIIKDFFKYNA